MEDEDDQRVLRGDGQVAFTNLATGEYEIKTFHLGVLVKEGHVTLTRDHSYSAVCPVYELAIQVFDIIPSPLPGASVTVSLPDGTALFSGTTNEKGSVTFCQAPVADYEVKATYLFTSSSTKIALNQNLTIQIRLPTLNITTILLIIAIIGIIVILIGAHYSKRGEEKPKRRRGRPRKVKTPI